MRTKILASFEESLAECTNAIRAAAERGDHAEVRRIAHFLKGSSATLGAARLQAICERLQHSGRELDPDLRRDEVESLAATGVLACAALKDALC
jgi:HPt (histidine-containing phosphotransfer) domain-containing protein